MGTDLWDKEWIVCEGPACNKRVPTWKSEALDFCSERCQNTYYRWSKRP